MRVSSFILPTTVLLALVGAFAAGHYIGKHDEHKINAAAVNDLDTSRRAEVFLMVSYARQALHEAKPEHAELVMVRYAALQAPALTACSSSPACAAWVGRLLPTKTQLDEVVATERALNGKLWISN